LHHVRILRGGLPRRGDLPEPQLRVRADHAGRDDLSEGETSAARRHATRRDPEVGAQVSAPAVLDPSARLTEEEAVARIPELKRRLGKDLLILGHHYQRDEVIQFADLTGDSYGLARQASQRHESQYIVFCGVHFMAESADILAAPHQRVV